VPINLPELIAAGAKDSALTMIGRLAQQMPP
jgi:hypothetical protein